MRGVLVVLVLVLAAAAGTPRSAGAQPRPLETALFDLDALSPSFGDAWFTRVRATTGATVVRLNLAWHDVAPMVRPETFDPRDPADPAYRWETMDRAVTLARGNGLEPLVSISGAPTWAQGRPRRAGYGPHRPSPVELGHFAYAAALRYSGRREAFARVRYWKVWNEPNLTFFLDPQFVGRTPFSPGWYRQMVNQMGAAVKAVHADNLVVAGGTAPFRDSHPDVQRVTREWGPLGFMRELLCLDVRLQRKCRAPVRFDVWAHHPYTSGGPTRKAVLQDDVSLGDLADMRRVLNAGVRSGNVVSRARPAFWVTEFSWDTKPPDPQGVPLQLHARWVAEALYRMWANDVTLVTWFMLRDEPFPQSFIQSGLYFRGATFARDRPKPALTAFRFPFVAFPRHAQKRVFVWGRTPAGRAARVLVEQRFQGGWKRLGVVQTNRHGIFQTTFATQRTGFVRARTVDRSERTIPFSLAHVPDRFFRPFGTIEERGG